MSITAIKWILFSVFLLIVPVPFYLVVVGGLVPTVFSIFFSLMAIAAVITLSYNRNPIGAEKSFSERL